MRERYQQYQEDNDIDGLTFLIINNAGLFLTLSFYCCCNLGFSIIEFVTNES